VWVWRLVSRRAGCAKMRCFIFFSYLLRDLRFFLPLPRRQCDILSRCPPSDLFSMSLAFSSSDLILWCLTPLALPAAHGCGGTLAAGPLVALLTTSIVTGIDHRPKKIRCSYARISARGSTRRWGSLGVEAAIRRSRRLGGARRAPKRAYALEAEKSGIEATLHVRAADVGAPFAARAAWRETETDAGRKHTTCHIV
jgi:hypothetical protein